MTDMDCPFAEPTASISDSRTKTRRTDPLLVDWIHALGYPEAVGFSSGAEPDLDTSVDFSLLSQFFDNFLEVTGLAIAVIDLKGKVLASSRWQRLCLEFHRTHRETLAGCVKSDLFLSKELEDGVDGAIYRCANGLIDCSTPIVLDGVHVANLGIGQFLLSAPDLEYFKRQQVACGFDEEAYFKALAEVPIVPETKIPAILKFLRGLAQHIVRQSLAEQRSQSALEESRQGYEQLKELNRKIEETQSQLLQSEKMASIGQLAAGIAHEINNPIGFVNSNLGSLQRYVEDLLSLVDAYERAEALLPVDSPAARAVAEVKERIDFAYLKEDVTALLRESQDGVARVKGIVQDLKDFSHVDDNQWHEADLNRGLDSTLNVVWNELKYKAEVVKEYGDLPPVECMASQLNQVFMNLLVNAAQAIEQRGTITIRTGAGEASVWVEIADTGKGIAREHLPRIFEPFFTTKPVGKGTGLGLSICYGIVQKHRGRLEVESEEGKGTTFRLTLPIRQTEAAAAQEPDRT